MPEQTQEQSQLKQQLQEDWKAVEEFAHSRGCLLKAAIQYTDGGLFPQIVILKEPKEDTKTE